MLYGILFLQSDIHKIEIVQGKAARFISGDYKSRESDCVTRMLKDHELPLLEKRRKQLRLALKFKVVEGLIKVKYVSHVIKTVKLHTLSSHELKNSRCFNSKRCNTTIYKNSLFVRTVHARVGPAGRFDC